jgi:hypothetical protein
VGHACLGHTRDVEFGKHAVVWIGAYSPVDFVPKLATFRDALVGILACTFSLVCAFVHAAV